LKYFKDIFKIICFPSSDNPEGSPRTPKRRQWSIESAFAEKLDQEKALKLYYNYFIGDIVPAHHTDSQNFRQFLCYLNPDFCVPSRRKLSRDIGQFGEEAKGILSDLLSKVTFVATTADSWSAHNRSFLGMTVHWVNSTVHVQIVSAQIVSAQFVSAQIVSAQIVSGTNCIGNKLYREHIVSGTNCIGNKLYREQTVSGTICIGHKLYRLPFIFLPFHFLIFSKSKINCSIVSGLICDDF